jgi:predicted DNA-binding transcriptional regulator AlpA
MTSATTEPEAGRQGVGAKRHDYLSQNQVAKAIGVSWTCLDEKVRAGAFVAPDLIVFGRRKWLRATVEAWKKANSGRPAV